MYLTNNNNDIFKQLLTYYAFFEGCEEGTEKKKRKGKRGKKRNEYTSNLNLC